MARWWAPGQIHHLIAPERQRDAGGRMYRFVDWSDGGAREHDVTAPSGVEHVIITANYELLGQLSITSPVPGLQMMVNGTACTTPCLFDDAAGTNFSVDAPKNVAIGDSSRYEFEAWAGPHQCDPPGCNAHHRTPRSECCLPRVALAADAGRSRRRRNF
ncbi:MAG: hypothetical protein WDO18_12355 [Acidobacteriota bacterium]